MQYERKCFGYDNMFWIIRFNLNNTRNRRVKMRILITGGLGYIGSHLVVELLEQGHEVVVVDNLSNSTKENKKYIEGVVGKRFKLYVCAVKDIKPKMLRDVNIVYHLANYKYVDKSVNEPLEYYENNVSETIKLLETMKKANCKNLIFSSSASVYGEQSILPIKTSAWKKTDNVYGKTKLMQEEIIQDYAKTDKYFNATILRYFNPIGSELGIGGGIEKLLPNDSSKMFHIFGKDYATKDGTAVRDYIYIKDLVNCSIKVLENLHGLHIYNVGSGTGTSVKELIDKYVMKTGNPVMFEYKERRKGDIGISYADVSKTIKELDWCCEYSIEDAF